MIERGEGLLLTDDAINKSISDTFDSLCKANGCDVERRKRESTELDMDCSEQAGIVILLGGYANCVGYPHDMYEFNNKPYLRDIAKAQLKKCQEADK
jgi:hypothetical protein